MNISENGLKLIEEFEGFVPTQYRDSVGVLTIGYGTTEADVRPLPTFLTRTEAENLLRRKLQDKYQPAVDALRIPLNQNQFDALCSFCYNLGPAIFTTTGIGRLLRERNYVGAANDMLNYDHAGGQVLAGLRRRREDERALFLKPAVPIDPHHYLWFEKGPVKIDGNLLNERWIVKEYDTLRRHPFIHRPRLHRLRQHLLLLADRLSTIIQETGNSTAYHREWRKNQLRDRSEGKRLV